MTHAEHQIRGFAHYHAARCHCQATIHRRPDRLELHCPRCRETLRVQADQNPNAITAICREMALRVQQP